MNKSPDVRAHKIVCRKVAHLELPLSLVVKFGECISCRYSVCTLDYINFLLDEMAMHSNGGSDRLDKVDSHLEFIQVVSNQHGWVLGLYVELLYNIMDFLQ